jgi:hypothetical protein
MPQPAPAVPQIPAGWKPVQADFNLWVGNSFSFLSQPANFRAQLTVGQALTGGAFSVIDFDSILEDPYGGWSASGTGSQPAFSWQCPAGAGGWYDITISGFGASQGSGTANQLATGLMLNGSLWQLGSDDWAVPSAPSGSSGTVQVPLLPGDYVQAAVFATVGTTAPTTAGQLPAMELCWVSS